MTRYPGAEGSLAGARETAVSYEDGSGTSVVATTDCASFNDPKPYRTLTSARVTADYSAEGTSIKRRKRTYGHDASGNVTRSTDWGEWTSDVASGDETTTSRTYVYNTDEYMVDKVAFVETRAGASGGPLLRYQSFFYDGDLVGGASPSQGLVTKAAEGILHGGVLDEWATTLYEYDGDASGCPEVGNLTRVTDPTGAVTTATYHPGSCRYRATDTAWVGGTPETDGTPHTTTYSWHEGLGVIATRTDRNGRTLTLGYDALGRRDSVASTPPGGTSAPPCGTGRR